MKNIEKLIPYVKTAGEIIRIHINNNCILVEVIITFGIEKTINGKSTHYAIFSNLPNIILDMLYSKNLIKIQLAINLI